MVRRGRAHRTALLAGAVAATALIAACMPLPLPPVQPPPTTVPRPTPAPPEHRHLYVTRDDADDYRFAVGDTPAPEVEPPPEPEPDPDPDTVTEAGTGDATDAGGDTGDVVTIDAPWTNVGGNTRVVLWHDGIPVSRVQSACITFDDHAVPTQEGVALRVSDDRHPGRAIVVMKNIYAGFISFFNVHLVDLSLPEGPERYRRIGEPLDIWDAVGQNRPPWRLCARAHDSTVEFKVWRPELTEPAWDDPAHAHSVELPPGWNYAGQPGVYIGHLAAGSRAILTDVETWLEPPAAG